MNKVNIITMLLLIIYGTFIIGCTKKTNTSECNINNSKNNDSIELQDSIFLNRIIDGNSECNINNRENNNYIELLKLQDSIFLNRIIDGNFFDQEISDEQDYILVAKHCFDHIDEQYDETLADGLCQMLLKYPSKIDGLRKAINTLPLEQRSTAYVNMMVYITSSWVSYENYYSDTINLDKFYQDYPIFHKDTLIDNILQERKDNL